MSTSNLAKIQQWQNSTSSVMEMYLFDVRDNFDKYMSAWVKEDLIIPWSILQIEVWKNYTRSLRTLFWSLSSIVGISCRSCLAFIQLCTPVCTWCLMQYTASVSFIEGTDCVLGECRFNQMPDILLVGHLTMFWISFTSIEYHHLWKNKMTNCSTSDILSHMLRKRKHVFSLIKSHWTFLHFKWHTSCKLSHQTPTKPMKTMATMCIYVFLLHHNFFFFFYIFNGKACAPS